MWGVRFPVDDGVDRPGMEALSGVELTGTNRPKAYIIVIFVLCVCVHCTVLRQQAILYGGNPP